jgi:hypothetical protein
MEFVPNGVDRLIRREVQDQVLAQVFRAELPTIWQLQVLAELRKCVERELLLVRLTGTARPTPMLSPWSNAIV